MRQTIYLTMRKLTFIVSLLAGSICFGQTAVTSIPFELFGDHIFIKASVDGSEPLDMIFDTGSGITVIDKDVADRLQLVQREVVLNEGMVKGSLIKHNTISINGYQMEENINVYAAELDHLEISLGREFDGIVGYDFMRHHTVRINYNEKILQVYEYGDGPTQGTPIPFELVHSIPVIEGTVVLNNGEPHDGTFFVMTGAGTTLDFNTPYANKYDVIHKTGKHYSYPIKTISDVEAIQYEGHIISFQFGPEKLEDIAIGISQVKTGIHGHKEVSGILGNQILSMFNITYDYANKMLYMLHNRRYGRVLHANCAGIDVQLSQDKSKVLIHQVFEESPASEADIKINSELVEVNGKKTMSEINMAEVKELFKVDGSTLNIKVKEGNETRDITLQLRSLVTD